MRQIEMGQRFVEQEQLRFLGQQLGHDQALALSARQREEG